MTPRRRTFCRLIAAGRHTAYAAAIEAGYSERTAAMQASRLLTKDKNKEYIEQLREQYDKNVDVSAQWIREQLISVYQKCTEGTPVVDARGEEVGVWRFDSSGANKALDTLNRMSGNYEKDNTQKSSQVTFEMKLQ
jgi:phage terminase small subunit